MKTLLNTSTLSDGTVSTPIRSSLLQPVGAKGVIYNVPLDITVHEIQVCLQSLVKFVKRFKLRRDTTNIHCTSATTQCPNCNGEHTAGDRQCPKYRRESEVLRIKTTSKVSYAAACRLHRQSATAVHPQTTFTQRSREFPPLPIGYRPSPTSKPSTVHEPTDSIECGDFTTNFPFGNPLILSVFGTSYY